MSQHLVHSAIWNSFVPCRFPVIRHSAVQLFGHPQLLRHKLSSCLLTIIPVWTNYGPPLFPLSGPLPCLPMTTVPIFQPTESGSTTYLVFDSSTEAYGLLIHPHQGASSHNWSSGIGPFNPMTTKTTSPINWRTSSPLRPAKSPLSLPIEWHATPFNFTTLTASQSQIVHIQNKSI